MVSLNFEQTSLDGRGTPRPPRKTCEPQDQFPLNRRLGIVIGRYGCFESLVVFGVLKRANHCLGCKAVADGVAAGAPFAFFGPRPAALSGIASVGGDPPE